MCRQWNSIRCWAVSLLIPFLLIVYVSYITIVTSGDHTIPAGPRSVPTLKLIAVVSRHGNRGPLYSFPNDPYPANDTKHWPYGLSELTTFGRLQMYNLGVKIRDLYNGFLKPTYFASDVYATSTRLNRTLESGLSFLAGLYPPRGFQVWNEAIPWQPIPLFTDSPDTFKVFRKCPRYKKTEVAALQNVSAQYSSSISDIARKIAPYVSFGHDMSLWELYTVWDAVTCESYEGFPLPTWTKEMFSQPLVKLMSQAFIAENVYTEAMVRLVIGTLFDRLVEIFDGKIKGTLIPDRKVFYFSGHDSSLVALQAILGIALEDVVSIVPPASAIVFELHHDATSGDYTVQVLFIDGQSPKAEPRVMVIGGCESFCELNKLKYLTSRFRGVDFNTECQSLA